MGPSLANAPPILLYMPSWEPYSIVPSTIDTNTVIGQWKAAIQTKIYQPTPKKELDYFPEISQKQPKNTPTPLFLPYPYPLPTTHTVKP